MFRNEPRSALPATASAALLSIAPAALQAAPAAPPATALETIVVTAERIRDGLDAQRALTPGAVTVVDGADLYRREVSNLADLLRYVPGVWAESSSGSDELFFSSRGSNLDATDYDKNGIKLMQDGLPVTTADGNNHNRVIDPLSARYAMIAHGANALTYGASTLGGAIDFTSPTARNSAPLAAYLNGGSHGLRAGRLTGGRRRRDGRRLVTVEGKSWDGYRDHSKQERYGLYANAGWVHSPQVATRIYATYVHNDEELPGALTRDEVRADPDQASRAAMGGNYQKNVETRAPCREDDLAHRLEQHARGRPVVRGAVALPPDRRPDPGRLRRPRPGGSGGGLQPAGRHRSSRHRCPAALQPAGRRRTTCSRA